MRFASTMVHSFHIAYRSFRIYGYQVPRNIRSKMDDDDSHSIDIPANIVVDDDTRFATQREVRP